jgi:hypothetical protein
MPVNQSKFVRWARVAVSLACFLTIPALVFSQGQDASQFDLSTNAGVNAARAAMNGKTLDTRSGNCIRRGKSLSIITVGTFAFDLGCRFEGVFVKSRYFKTGETETWKDAIDLLGWQTLSATERESLALAWVRETWMAFLRVLTEKNEDLQDRPFKPPSAVSNDAGEIVVSLWINPPPRGRVRGRNYQLREFKFAKTGALISATTRENFNVLKDGGN